MRKENIRVVEVKGRLTCNKVKDKGRVGLYKILFFIVGSLGFIWEKGKYLN